MIGILTTVSSILLTVLIVKSASTSTRKFKETPKVISEGKNLILNLKLDGPILEKSPGFEEEFLARIFGKKEGIYLPDLRAMLRLAGKDDKVLGLFLNIDGVEGSFASVTELRDIISEFRDTGKQVYSWFSIGSDKSMYLASTGANISMAPVGDMSLPGPVFTLTYFGEALRKLGVGIEVIRSGKFKSAFEPFIADEPSPATKEMYQSMEADLRKHYVDRISKSRLGDSQSNLDKVAGWFKKSSFTMEQAVKEGIVDSLLYRDEALAAMETSLVASKIDMDDYEEYRMDSIDPGEESKPSDSLALIEATGEIHMDGGQEDGVITPSRIHDRVEWALEDATIKAVVLRVSSPGGSAIASDLIWADIARLAAKKPVIVSMGSYAASGGYYISAPATKIIAEPTTITGSIGVIGMVVKFKEFKEKYGLSFHVITGSDRASYYNPGELLTDQDKFIINESIETTYNTFVRKVAEGRKMTEKQVDDIAQGRVWTGQQALDIGLVDELGGLKESYQAAKKLAGLDVNLLYQVKQYKKKKLGLMECLRSPHDMAECFDQGGASLRAGLALQVSSPADEVMAQLHRFMKDVELSPIQAVWPGYFTSVAK
jgi:protease-4